MRACQPACMHAYVSVLRHASYDLTQKHTYPPRQPIHCLRWLLAAALCSARRGVRNAACYGKTQIVSARHCSSRIHFSVVPVPLFDFASGSCVRARLEIVKQNGRAQRHADRPPRKRVLLRFVYVCKRESERETGGVG